MTGPIPISPVNLSNGGVLSGSGAPDPLALFLQSFLQGSQQGGQSYQASEDRKQRASTSSAQQQIERDRIQLQRDQLRIEQQQKANEGEAIKALTVRLAGANDAQNNAHERQMAPMPITGQPLVQPGVGPLPQMQQTPSNVPAPAERDPFKILAGVMQGIDPAVAADFLTKSHPIFQDAVKRQAQGKADAENEAVVARLPAAQQGAARSVMRLAQIGANLPAAMQQKMFPELFPEGQAVDPSVVNAFSTLFKTGSFTAGQAALTAGLSLPRGVPTGIKYVPPRNPQLSQLLGTVRDRQFANLHTEMEAANIAYTAWEDAHPKGLSFVGQLRKDGMGTGFTAALKRGISAGLVKPDEAAAITAAFDFSVAWGHAISGARLPDNQLAGILHNTTAEVGDSPEARKYKRTMRSVMIQGMADITKGVRTRSQVLGEMEKLDWTPEQKRMLREQRGQALRHEQDIKTGKAPVPVLGTAPADPNDMQDQIDQLRAMLGASMASQPPEP